MKESHTALQMSQLPDLVLQNIFEQSDFQDLARIACVSKRFHEIAATAHGNTLSLANKDEEIAWIGLGDSKTCICWTQKNLSRLDRVSSIIHCPRAFGTEISSLLGLLPSLTSACLWGPTIGLNFDYKLLPSQLKFLSIEPQHVALETLLTSSLVSLANHVSLSLFYADLLQTCLVVQGCTLFSTRLGRISLTYCTCTHTCYESHQTSQI